MGRLLVLGAACHQITFIVVESWLFKGLRDAFAARSEHLGKLVSCHLCFGTWVGLMLAALLRPRFVTPRQRQPLARSVLAWAIDGFAIALVGRAINEVMAYARHEVEVKEKEVELVEALAEEEPQGIG